MFLPRKMETTGRVLVAHTYNHSYSGERDQEDGGSKPAPGKYFARPYLEKKNHHKKGLVEWLKSKSTA
jgi:hypothetical protein